MEFVTSSSFSSSFPYSSLTTNIASGKRPRDHSNTIRFQKPGQVAEIRVLVVRIGYISAFVFRACSRQNGDAAGWEFRSESVAPVCVFEGG